jgi:hypothetical protein
MFGYVKTDMPNMFVKDTVLYKAMYCGLCKGIGKACGQRGRMVLNYDLTFLSVFLHNITGIDVKVEKQHCVIHPITKRPIAIPDELTERIGCLNVILAYYKLCDDVIDSKKGRIKRSLIKRAYKKAKVKEPELDKIVKDRYDELLKYERINGDSIDFASDPFGKMMQEVVAVLIGEKFTDNISDLSYDLGKWIYLIDALDDFDKDIKKKNYNVLVNAYPNIKCKKELVQEKGQDLATIFGSLLSDIDVKVKNVDYKFNHDLIDNILLRGLFLQTKTVMEITK